jgi:hypothetical protein
MPELAPRLPIPEERLLLDELNHRINNEFTSLIGIVSLAAAASANDEVKRALGDPRRRGGLPRQTVSRGQSIETRSLEDRLDARGPSVAAGIGSALAIGDDRERVDNQCGTARICRRPGKNSRRIVPCRRICQMHSVRQRIGSRAYSGGPRAQNRRGADKGSGRMLEAHVASRGDCRDPGFPVRGTGKSRLGRLSACADHVDQLNVPLLQAHPMIMTSQEPTKVARMEVPGAAEHVRN